MSNQRTISLPAGYQLDISADGLSSGYFYEIGGTGITAVAAGASTSVGPFATVKNYGVVSETGTLQITQSPAIASGGISSLEDDTTPTLGGDLDLNTHNIDFPTVADVSDVIDDDTFATASDTTLATSESIKAYVDAQVSGSGIAWSTPVDANIIPDANATRDLGSTGTRFDELFVDDIIVTNNVDGRDVSVDGTKLDGIEAGADVTDEANVTSALSGATLTSVTVATNDKVLIQDTSDSDNIKTVTAQSIADLASGASTLDDLTDVVVTTPANLDILSYNGSNWVNEAIESTTIATGDRVLIQDVSASNAYKYDTVSNLLALASSGDLVKISSADATSQSQVDFTGLSSTYKAYMVIIEGLIVTTDGAFLFLRMSTDNGSSFDTDNDYRYTASFITRAGTSGNTKDTDIAQTVIALTGEGVGNQSDEGVAGTVTVFNPSNSGTYKRVTGLLAYKNSAGNVGSTTVAGEYQSNTAVDAIRFYASGGFSAGTITLYGVKA